MHGGDPRQLIGETREPIAAALGWPEHGSWLNMTEIEMNVMVKQCLDRRIDNIETVTSEVAAWQARRDNLQAKVNW